jgi:hypothetical protein
MRGNLQRQKNQESRQWWEVLPSPSPTAAEAAKVEEAEAARAAAGGRAGRGQCLGTRARPMTPLNDAQCSLVH